MKRVDLSIPEFMFIVATRAAFAAGVALLAGGKLSRGSRRRVGKTLIGIGAVTTIPAGYFLFGRGGSRAF
jgi:hypothetical protein